jgi:Asp-tRNA(Asn)/Glu-tRNA(Gln) amidotransferase A subunit family amidase
MSAVRVFHRARSVGPAFIVPRPDDEVMDCVLDAAAHMEQAGAVVKPCPDFPLFNQALDLWSGAMNVHKDMSFRQHLSTDGLHSGAGGQRVGTPMSPTCDEHNSTVIGDVRVFNELAKWVVGRSSHTFPALGLCLVEDVMAYMPGRLADLSSKCETLLSQLEDTLGDDGVLLFVCMPRAAPKHGQPITPGHLFSFAYCSLFNALGLPSTAVPTGLNKAGLPLGIQVVAKRGNDHLCVAVAMELERAFGGWVDMTVEASE